MNVLRKLDINTIINEGFGNIEEVKHHDKEALNSIVNSFVPTMRTIVALFKYDTKTEMSYEELLSYSYIATAAAVMEYKISDGEFGEYVSAYIVDSLKEVANEDKFSMPVEKVTYNFICTNDKCNGLDNNCLEKNCFNKKRNNDKEELLLKAKELLTTLNEKQSKTLAPIINGEIEDPKEFTPTQQKTLIKLRKEL